MAKAQKLGPQSEPAAGAEPDPRADSAPVEMPTMPIRLAEKHGKGLAEVARLDGLGNVALAFEKHFGARLEQLVIDLTKRRLKQLEDEAAVARTKPRGFFSRLFGRPSEPYMQVRDKVRAVLEQAAEAGVPSIEVLKEEWDENFQRLMKSIEGASAEMEWLREENARLKAEIAAKPPATS